MEWICHGVAVPWLTGAPPPPFNQSVSCRGLPRDQATFLHEEIERLTLSGVLRPIEYSRWVSRAFLVPKPAGSAWRLIVDLIEIKKPCQTRKMKMETLRSPRLITKPFDHWVSFDLKVRLDIGFVSANRYISVFLKPNPIYIGIPESQTDKSDTI